MALIVTTLAQSLWGRTGTVASPFDGTYVRLHFENNNAFPSVLESPSCQLSFLHGLLYNTKVNPGVQKWLVLLLPVRVTWEDVTIAQALAAIFKRQSSYLLGSVGFTDLYFAVCTIVLTKISTLCGSKGRYWYL